MMAQTNHIMELAVWSYGPMAVDLSWKMYGGLLHGFDAEGRKVASVWPSTDYGCALEEYRARRLKPSRKN